MEEINPELGNQLKNVIRTQIRINKPPITKQTFERLQKEGIEKEECIRLMTIVLALELSHMLNEQRVFDEKKFTEQMNRLPELPQE